MGMMEYEKDNIFICHYPYYIAKSQKINKNYVDYTNYPYIGHILLFYFY